MSPSRKTDRATTRRVEAGFRQMESLGLAPWQTPPALLADLDQALQLPFGDPRGEREAAELLKRMLAAGLTGLEADPLAALAAAERSAPP